MMKTIGKLFICTLVFVGFGLQYVQAQAISMVEKREVYDKEHIPNKDPIPYPFVREANVMREKVIWRMVNLLKGKDSCFGCGSYKECVKNKRCL